MMFSEVVQEELEEPWIDKKLDIPIVNLGEEVAQFDEAEAVEDVKESDYEFKEVSTRGSKCRFFVTSARPLSSTRSRFRSMESLLAMPE